MKEINQEKKKLLITTGANESHRVIGIDSPSINCEEAAVKNDSKAEENISLFHYHI